MASPLGIALGNFLALCFADNIDNPIGLGTIGSPYSGESISMDLVVASCESISTGTFLFVVFIGKFQAMTVNEWVISYDS